MPEIESGTPQPEKDSAAPPSGCRPGCLIALALLVVFPGGCLWAFASEWDILYGGNPPPQWQPWAIAAVTITVTISILVPAVTARSRSRRTLSGGWGGWWRVREPGAPLLNGPAGAETGVRLASGTPVLAREKRGDYLEIRVGSGPRVGWVHQDSLSRE